jgi:hypothetical protein
MADRTVVITDDVAEDLAVALIWARIYLADTSTSTSTEREGYATIDRVAEAFGIKV